MLSGLTQMPEVSAIIRNIYLGVIGFVVSYVLALFYRQYLIERFRQLIWPVLGMSYLAGVFCTISVNPITFGQLGVPLSDLTSGQLFSGSLNFALVFALWSTIYFSFQGVPLWRSTSGREFISTLVAESAGARLVLQLDDVYLLKSAGDYVEIITREKSFIKRAYLGTLSEQLDPDKFVRIHRSLMLHADKIADIEILSKGRIEFTLDNGTTARSSRGYRDAIAGRFNLD